MQVKVLRLMQERQAYEVANSTSRRPYNRRSKYCDKVSQIQILSISYKLYKDGIMLSRIIKTMLQMVKVTAYMQSQGLTSTR